MNRFSTFAVLSSLFVSFFTPARSQPGVVRQLETCPCQVKIDSTFRTRCAYLIVPENRKKKNGKTIKLPFILVESKNPAKKKDPILFTGGGPGASSLGWVQGAASSLVINDRDCIAFEQRGTYYAVPNLDGPELGQAIQEAYRKNLNKDSMEVVGVKRYKKALEAKGIDLAGYNTDETVSDMHDLLATLKIDSVNLLGISYSGGLMSAVLQRDPTRVRSLILDSPLPIFVPIDEDEPANFGEALNILFDHVERDSTDKARYGNLKARFEHYFNSIESKTFTFPYLEKGAKDTLRVQYTRNELLDYLVNVMYNASRIKQIPAIITEIMQGNHHYVKEVLDSKLSGYSGPSGMRLSVYCADQTAYHSEQVKQQLYDAYPYLRGYHINDVYQPLCDCWKVPPINPNTKRPFYSNKPALLVDGELDNACRPLYIDRIHHYLPNSQRVLFKLRSHGVGGPDWARLFQAFLTNPYQKLKSDKPEIVVY